MTNPENAGRYASPPELGEEREEASDRRLPDQPRLMYGGVLAILSDVDLGRVLYQRPRWRVMEKGDGFLVQLVYEEADVTKPDSQPVPQFCRKWYVSAHSTPTEIVRTAYKAVLCSLEHRLGEHFRFRGEQVYSPHRRLVTNGGARG